MFPIGFRFFDGFADSFQIVAVGNFQRLEAEGLHPFLHVFRKGDIRAAFDGDVVAVVQDDQLAQAQRACQREGFRGDAFHHAAVAAEDEGVMVNDGIFGLVEYGCQMSFGHCHADGHGHAGTQGARRSFYADGVAVFGMARRQGAVLAELLHVVEGQAVAEEVQQRIEQHGAVAAGQDKAVAIGPFRIFSVVLHMVSPQFVCNRRGAQGKARMAGVCLLNGVCRQHADCIYTSRVNCTHDLLSPLYIPYKHTYLYYGKPRRFCQSSIHKKQRPLQNRLHVLRRIGYNENRTDILSSERTCHG